MRDSVSGWINVLYLTREGGLSVVFMLLDAGRIPTPHTIALFATIAIHI